MKEIPLTQGKVALVDDTDFERFSKFKWCFNAKKGTHGYAQRSKHIRLGDKKYVTKTIYLHREVLECEAEIDHINGNTLDNRRDNLRESNRQQQARNVKSRTGSSSKFVGVHFHKGTGKWRAQITVEPGKIKSLGLFSSQEEANNARVRFIDTNQLSGFRR